jgi:hypothetical protein
MRNTVFKLFAATIVTGVLAHPVIAQELKPLEQLMKRPSDQFEPSYPFVRCAAYYKGTAEYMGAARLSSQHIENIQKSVTMNAFAAVKIRASKRGGNPNDYVDQVTDDVNRIVAVYQVGCVKTMLRQDRRSLKIR